MSARPERGFTLLELLVVIAIMAALTAAFPLALNRFVPARRIDAAARVLVADIQLARALSVSSNRPVALEVDPRGYRFAGGERRDLRATTTLDLRSADGALNLSALRIFPDGSTTGGSFVFSDGQRQRRVAVSALTGRITLENPLP